MVRLKAKLLKGGVLEIGGLEQFIDGRLAEFKKALGLTKAETPKATEYVRPAAVKPVAKKATKKAGKTAKTQAAATDDAFEVVMATLARHPAKAALVKAGSQPDQLLRSLIPLYLAQQSGAKVTSGTINKFWQKHGVKFAAPNAAKALREHVGYARASKNGPQITPNGVKYVEAALQKKAA